ncbi:MAG: hypothetical protein IKR18_11975, partial [Bacteroidaceae bacterium]|nr:hypothetical protein [Bacteroidaceae bacterium]
LKEKVMDEAEKCSRPSALRFVPWLVAACVAGVLVVFLTPPKSTEPRIAAPKNVAKVERVVKHVSKPADSPATVSVVNEKAEAPQPVRRTKPRAVPSVPTEQQNVQMAVATAPQPMAVAEAKPEVVQVKVVDERNIPITRPENLRYTPEEIEQLKRQAREAYLKWMQLEMEIINSDSRRMTQEIEKSLKSDTKNKNI